MFQIFECNFFCFANQIPPGRVLHWKYQANSHILIDKNWITQFPQFLCWKSWKYQKKHNWDDKPDVAGISIHKVMIIFLSESCKSRDLLEEKMEFTNFNIQIIIVAYFLIIISTFLLNDDLCYLCNYLKTYKILEIL